VLLPTLILPFTDSFIVHSKLFMVLFGAIATAILYFFISFKDRVWKVIVSPITLPLILFGLTVAASTFFTQNYPVENLLGIGGVYLASIVIALLGASLIDKKKTHLAIPALVVAVSVVNLGSLLQLFGWGPTRIIAAITGFEFEHNLLFNLSMSSFVAAQLGVLALIASVVKIVKNKKVSTFEVITLPILLFGLGLHLWSMLPGQPAEVVLPPMSASWSVALDSLRIPRAALIGQGPEGYVGAFTRYRPATLNTDRLWQTRFDSAMGAPLTLLVQLGFLGLIAWLVLAGRFFLKSTKDELLKESPLSLVVLASFVIQFFLPPNYIMIGLQGILIAFWIADLKEHFSVLKLRPLSASLDSNKQSSRSAQEKTKTENIISLGTNGAMIAGLLFLTFATGRAYASFHQMFLAEKAIMNDDGVAVYEHRQRAMILNPYHDTIRRSYALTNLQIAIALSNKTDLTEQEQEQISELVQQAVREAQAATTIDPQDSQNWIVLAQIYQELIGSVEEADQWAVNAYVSAIQTDPSDPLLRIQLGNILLQQEQLQQAANLFSQAIELKPDLAAGYFYLGQVQQMGQDPIGAQRSWQQALALLETGTEDYEMLQQLLEELEPLVEEAQAQLAQQEQAMQQQQFDESGQPLSMDEMPEGFDAAPGTSPLGQQLPSLTDQNIESRENIVSQPGAAPLELSEEDANLLQQQESEPEEIPEEEGEFELE
jgi:tetratricopeptide (TPR) repeat protein